MVSIPSQIETALSSLTLRVTNTWSASIVNAGTYMRFNSTNGTGHAPYVTTPMIIKWQKDSSSSAYEDHHSFSHIPQDSTFAPYQNDPVDTTSVAKNDIKTVQGHENGTSLRHKQTQSPSLPVSSTEKGNLRVSRI